jgi:hypothetical protein
MYKMDYSTGQELESFKGLKFFKTKYMCNACANPLTESNRSFWAGALRTILPGWRTLCIRIGRRNFAIVADDGRQDLRSVEVFGFDYRCSYGR